MDGQYVDDLQGYIPVDGPTLFPSTTNEQLVDALTSEQLKALKQHALCLACLAGNAFPDLIDQYLVDAYNNLWQNGWLDDGRYTGIRIVNIYPQTASEHWHTGRDAMLRAYGIDPDDPDAGIKYMKASYTPVKDPPKGGLAVLDSDGKVTEIILSNKSSCFDLIVAEARQIIDKLSDATKNAST